MNQPLSDFDRGVLIGILVGEGHFGGDGKQPQVTLRMHTKHRQLFSWLIERFPRTKLYGPYSHSGRNYMQWMVRGQALIEDLLPELQLGMKEELDEYVWKRYKKMLSDYATFLERHKVQKQ